jgi:hypothetical protein
LQHFKAKSSLIIFPCLIFSIYEYKIIHIQHELFRITGILNPTFRARHWFLLVQSFSFDQFGILMKLSFALFLTSLNDWCKIDGRGAFFGNCNNEWINPPVPATIRVAKESASNKSSCKTRTHCSGQLKLWWFCVWWHWFMNSKFKNKLCWKKG